MFKTIEKSVQHRIHIYSFLRDLLCSRFSLQTITDFIVG